MKCKAGNIAVATPLLTASLALACSFAPFSLKAAGSWYTSSWSSGFKPSESNVLFGRVPASITGLSDREGAKVVDPLTDGDAVVRNNKDKTTCLNSNAVLTYSLGEALVVNEVRIYSTWADGGRDNLTVDSVVAETSEGESIVLSPSAISYAGDGCCACAILKNEDGSALCSDVVKITFNFGVQENGYAGYAELEVLAEGFIAAKSKAVEITAGGDVEITSTPNDPVLYGPNGGNLVISGADTVVYQNIPQDRDMAGIDFKNYWPWIEGTVTVKDGAKLISNTQLFRGSGIGFSAALNKSRQLLVTSGATATFTPPNGELYIVGVENCNASKHAFVSVSGSNSKLFLPAVTYLGNKSDFAGHYGDLEVRDGGYAEGGLLRVGHHTGPLNLIVDGGAIKFTSGISCFQDGNRWTGATIVFKDCTVDTAFYKMTYPHGNGGSSVTFNGALFKPAGTPAEKFIVASPTGDPRCPHTLTGGGLAVESPEGTALEVTAKFIGDGGFTKLGDGTVTMSATNEYVGATTVSAGTLRLTGNVAGALKVCENATLALPTSGEISTPASVEFEPGAKLAAIEPGLPEGVRRVVVLRTEGEIVGRPETADDSSKCRFFISKYSTGNQIWYGYPEGLLLFFK